MKVLWSTFIVLPEVAEKVGMKAIYACTWVRAMAERLRKRDDVELAIVTVGNKPKIQKIESNGINFYFLPGGKKTYKNGGGCEVGSAWKEILDDFRPDVIHVYGTEYAHTKLLISMKQPVPIIISLQGILKDYQKDYYGGLPFSTALRYTTLRDVVRGSGMILDTVRLKKNIENECEAIRSVKYVEGRTFWDEVAAKAINKDVMYYYCPRMIRHEFYTENAWNIKDVERHSIFVHQGFKPLKGLHFVLRAVATLKEKYPDIKLYIAGDDRLIIKTLKDRLFAYGYKVYINKLIEELDLGNNIIFTGTLDAAGMVEKLKKVNVMVLPSSIENSPNSLVESMLVGTPCISSFVGGVPGMLKHEEEGLLYCFNESNVLASYIERIFDSDELSNKFSSAARKRKFAEHDENKLEEQLINIYKDVIAMEAQHEHPQ